MQIETVDATICILVNLGSVFISDKLTIDNNCARLSSLMLKRYYLPCLNV
jgi:hypothetical protein